MYLLHSNHTISSTKSTTSPATTTIVITITAATTHQHRTVHHGELPRLLVQRPHQLALRLLDGHLVTPLDDHMQSLLTCLWHTTRGDVHAPGDDDRQAVDPLHQLLRCDPGQHPLPGLRRVVVDIQLIVDILGLLTVGHSRKGARGGASGGYSGGNELLRDELGLGLGRFRIDHSTATVATTAGNIR